MNLLDVQVQEMKSMSNAIRKLEGTLHLSLGSSTLLIYLAFGFYSCCLLPKQTALSAAVLISKDASTIISLW